MRPWYPKAKGRFWSIRLSKSVAIILFHPIDVQICKAVLMHDSFMV